jgi:hypothetical protein
MSGASSFSRRAPLLLGLGLGVLAAAALIVLAGWMLAALTEAAVGGLAGVLT